MKKSGLFVLAVLFVMACSKEDKGNVSVKFKGVNTTLKSASSVASVVKITDFKISIRDVQFKMDESELEGSEVEFRGPYDIDLMSTTDALSETIGTVDIPSGTYKVLRFKMHKSDDRKTTDPLYDRSIYMKGTIDGVPFEYWDDSSENFDIGNATGIVVSDNKVNVAVVFNIDQFLNSVNIVNLASANDGNDDGKIEIGGDDDGNHEIADDIRENIEASAQLVEL